MSDYKIICPYCFREFDHTKVHFRSERVNKGECEAIPDDYGDIEEFKIRYRGSDKEQILQQCLDWSFSRRQRIPSTKNSGMTRTTDTVEQPNTIRLMKNWVCSLTDEE